MFPPNWTTTGAEWDSKAVTATSAFVTQGAFMGPASSPGSATVRRAGEDSSATKVRRTFDRSTAGMMGKAREESNTGRNGCLECINSFNTIPHGSRQRWRRNNISNMKIEHKSGGRDIKTGQQLAQDEQQRHESPGTGNKKPLEEERVMCVRGQKDILSLLLLSCHVLCSGLIHMCLSRSQLLHSPQALHEWRHL